MAAKKEWTLAFAIGAKLQSSYPAAFKNAQKHIAALQKSAKNTGAAWKNFTGKATKLAATMTGLATAAGAAAFGLANSAANVGDAYAKTAAKLGFTVEGFQGLQYAMGKAGVTAEAFDTSMTKYRSTLAKMAATPDAGKPLAEFGLSAKKLFAMQPEKAIGRVADYMNTIKDPAKKARLAVTLFGEKAGPKMAAAMAQGSEGMKAAVAEAERLGFIMSKEQTAMAEKFNDQKTAMLSTIGGMKNTLGTRLMPTFIKLFDSISDIIARNMPAIKEWADRMAAAIERNLPKIEDMIKAFGDFMKKVRDTVLQVKDFVGGWGNLAKIGLALWVLPTAISAITVAVNVGRTALAAYSLAQRVLTGLKIKDKAESLYLMALYAKDAVMKGVSTAATWAQTAAMKVATAAQWLFNAALTANPIGIAVVALAALAAGFIFAYKKCEWFRNIVDSAVSAIIGFFKSAYETIKGVWNAIPAFFSGLWASVTGAVPAFITGVVEFFSGLLDGVSGIVGKIPGFFTDAWKSVRDSVGGFITGVMDKFKPLTKFFDGIGNTIGKIFGGKKTLQVDVSTAGVQPVPGHAAGGIFSKPHFAKFAENAPRVKEAAIPIENTARSFDLWSRVGDMAGFNTGKQHLAPVMVGGGGTTTISLSMPITIKGNATPETVKELESNRDNLLSQVKAMIEQSMNEQSSRGGRLKYA